VNFELVPATDPRLAPTKATQNGAPVPSDDAVAAEMERVKAARQAAEARAQAAADKRAEAAQAPAALLEQEKIALADAERRAQLEEHEAKTDAIYRAACVQYGSDRVARIVTRVGSIVMRPQSEPERDAEEAAIAAFHRRAAEAKTPEEAAAFRRNAEEAARRDLRKTVLSDKDHFERVTATHHQLWGVIASAQNALVDGRILDEGKGGAR